MSSRSATGFFRRIVAFTAFAPVYVASVLPLRAAEVSAAIAANFTEPAREIAGLFEKATGHKLILSFGSTGQFYAQITQGAPFDVLLAADRSTPEKAVRDDLAVADSTFTYATGRLVLFSIDNNRTLNAATLKDGTFDKIAIANPETAPYGVAAVETMRNLGVLSSLKPKFVQGNSIAQAYQFVASGNAELGFVAMSQTVTLNSGSRWLVPADLHSPIAQDVVLLKQGANNDAARAFLTFLRSPEARQVIAKYGYDNAGNP